MDSVVEKDVKLRWIKPLEDCTKEKVDSRNG